MGSKVYPTDGTDPVALAPIDPDYDEQDYQWDWSGLLNGDTIASATFVVPAVFTEPTASSNTTTTSTVWLKAADAVKGRTYEVEGRIVTAAGRKYSRTVSIRVADR